ncbi:carbon-monoxide dehydrogenase medium subunit [Roseivivax halotolerans]|uniref:Carbon-monoxide dehydrogenase medium subunit n=1 Tax=Roseivivax halotolerans TaxID=93684 RepID=A0A1I5WZ52_9RHOB|nr:xanthine dehydrogenase family protein subunit M [Roseivivax halotolerans]SFQ24787.1 carbon-monoxide dehydrogenase medium subunit [Roseivivax halotolerans]
MYNFDLVRPTSIDEAVKALGEEDAQPLAGGQTLIPTLKQRLAMPTKLVSLTGIADIKGVCKTDDGQLAIGGGTTHGTVAKEAMADFPGLANLAANVGDPAVRNRGTIGGSLANNDPSACYPAAALGTGATIKTNKREIAADDYFQGMFATALEEAEIITEVRFPIPEKSNYQKFEQQASRFALVGVFVAKYADGVRVAVTGASNEGVFRWSEAESALSSNFSAEAIDSLSAPDGSNMISDLHGSGDYRAHIVKVMTKRAVAAAS